MRGYRLTQAAVAYKRSSLRGTAWLALGTMRARVRARVCVCACVRVCVHASPAALCADSDRTVAPGTGLLLGGAGVLVSFSAAWAEQLCARLGPNWAADFWWVCLMGAAAACVLRYFVARESHLDPAAYDYTAYSFELLPS